MNRARIKVAAAFDKADIVISMPKFKNHELVYFTGAIKNTLGLYLALLREAACPLSEQEQLW